MDEVEDMGNIIKSEFLKLKRYYVVKAWKFIYDSTFSVTDTVLFHS